MSAITAAEQAGSISPRTAKAGYVEPVGENELAIIDAHGLFNGKRLRRCSNTARLYWPYLFAMSNGWGRLELDTERIASEFWSFRPQPTRTEIYGILQEFAEAHLLFIYKAIDGSTWGQWETRPEDLPRYKSASDRRSPVPPEDELKKWREAYRESNNTATNDLRKVTKDSETFALGIGVGVGEGGGKTTAPSAQSHGTRLPESFGVTEEHREFAKKHNLPDPESVIDEFRDYWRGMPGQRGRKTDWDATFRNRLREIGGRRNGRTNGKRESVFERVAEELDQKDRSRLPDV